MDIYRLGLDYLRFNIFNNGNEIPRLDNFFMGLSSNSNTKHGVSWLGFDFDVVYSDHRNKEVLMFSYEGDTVIELVRFRDSGIIERVQFVCSFYGSYWYVSSLSSFVGKFVRSFVDSSVSLSVARVDVALDCSLSVDQLRSNYCTQFKKFASHEKSEDTETFYLGSKANCKRHFIRVYNKKLDSRKKGKFHLFMPYLSVPIVSRVEVQCNVETCRALGLTANNILRDSKIRQIFRTLCINESGTCFYHLLDTSLHDIKKIHMDMSVKKNDVLDELPYANRMLGYARRLKEYGFDPIDFLEEKL